VYDYERNCIWAFTWSAIVKVDRETCQQLGFWTVPIYGEEIFSATFNGEYIFCGNGPNPKPAEVVRINPDNPSDQTIWRLSNFINVGSELYWVHTLISDADGIVYAGLYRTGYIVIIDPITGPTDQIAVNRWHLHGLAFDESGSLWCCFNEMPGKLYKYFVGGETPPPPPPPPPPSLATVNGTLRYANGSAMSNAKVSIGSYNTYTDENGFYSLIIPTGTYNMTITVNKGFTEEKTYTLDFTISEGD